MRSFEFYENDWTLEMVEGEREVVQVIEQNLVTRLGEWFLNETVGLERLYEEKAYDMRLIKLAIVDAIMYESRVKEVTKIETELNRYTRKLDVYVELTAVVENEEVEVQLNVAL